MSAGTAQSAIMPNVITKPAKSCNQTVEVRILTASQIREISGMNPIGPLARKARASEANNLSHDRHSDVGRPAAAVRFLPNGANDTQDVDNATVINRTSHILATAALARTNVCRHNLNM